MSRSRSGSCLRRYGKVKLWTPRILQFCRDSRVEPARKADAHLVRINVKDMIASQLRGVWSSVSERRYRGARQSGNWVDVREAVAI